MNSSYGIAARVRSLRSAACRTRVLARLLTGVAGCTLMLGCGGSAEPTPEGSAGAAASEAGAGGTAASAARTGAGTGTSRDACELLTAEEVAAVHGEPVEALPEDEGPYRSSCLYSPPGISKWQVMWLTVHWRGGREEWITQQTGRGIGTRVMGTEAEGADSLTRPDPLAGIGDAAYYGGLLPSLVLKGDVLLEFMMPLLRNDREHFPELARKAVSRL